jgi:hypothetical protein
MAETQKKDNGAKESADAAPAAGKAAGAQRKAMGVRLVPVGDSDQPVVANYTTISLAPGMAFVDFGFLEPGVLAALPRVARQGGKLPERINGRLAVRVAMGYDALVGLQRQVTQVLRGLSQSGREEGE